MNISEFKVRTPEPHLYLVLTD